jgi:DNA (cytosine-5)-methyltransferase 3A
MPVKDRDIITRELGVEPVMFNASLVSAQNRKRLFWTNIVFELPADRRIFLKDILEEDGVVYAPMVSNGKAHCLTSSYCKVSASPRQIEHNTEKGQRTMVLGASMRGRKQADGTYKKQLEVRQDGKASSLTAMATKDLALVQIGKKELALHIPDGDCVSSVRVAHEQRRKLKDGVRADNDPDIVAERRLETRNDDKSGTITTIPKDNHLINTDTLQVRILTPVECERLQGLPDGYTDCIAKTWRYKVLGNAFNVDVICCIFKQLGDGENT